MLRRIALMAIAAPRRIIAISALILVAAAIFGLPVVKSLSAGGYQNPNSESARANQLLANKLQQGGMPLVVVVSAPDGVRNPRAQATAAEIVDRLRKSPHVSSVTSAWTAPPSAVTDLISRDGRSGLILASIRGGENKAPQYAAALMREFPSDVDGVSMRAGGMSIAFDQMPKQVERDVLTMELVAVPLSFVVLVWVFGGLAAAAVPIAAAAVAIAISLSVLRLITFGTEVTVFALNLTTATSLALGIDYTLLLISRYRDEIAAGKDPEAALIRTMNTAGRTVLFSATVVALSASTMVLFPSYFLKSFAYVGLATVAVTAVTAIVLTPTIIVLLGPRLNALDIRQLVPDPLVRFGREQPPAEQMFWYRWSKFVMRHALPLGLAVTVLLILLVAPFSSVTWGPGDDRALPKSASSRQVGDQLREDFPQNTASEVQVVISHLTGVTSQQIAEYSARLSGLSDVRAVSSPAGTFIDGLNVGPPSAPTGAVDDSMFVTISGAAPPFSERAETQLDLIRGVTAPGGGTVQITGLTQVNRDNVDAVTARLPLVLTVIGVLTFVLMFVLTGSVVLPVKTLVLNVLSLTAAFGAVVWIFQDGHLGAFGTTPTGRLDIAMPVMLFCMAFGLSMDYEVFLVARIREFWLASKSTNPPGDNDESVALGVAHTGRIITAAALVMSISFAALMVSQVAPMRMLGLALALAVIVDATLVRMVLVPAFMHVLGRWNWWAPRPLAWLHDRIRFSESSDRVIA
ncbi:MAG TPA: MMPL family transporter [Mycobacterium sp.]|nr:MMPL family transporter [Mycobacterium sp.]